MTHAFATRRGDLVAVAGAETGKILAEGDVEVSEAIDFAAWYADRAEELEAVDGAQFVPPRVTVVTPPWNFALSITAGSTLAALAAGSPVLLKPPHRPATVLPSSPNACGRLGFRGTSCSSSILRKMRLVSTW